MSPYDVPYRTIPYRTGYQLFEACKVHGVVYCTGEAILGQFCGGIKFACTSSRAGAHRFRRLECAVHGQAELGMMMHRGVWVVAPFSFFAWPAK